MNNLVVLSQINWFEHAVLHNPRVYRNLYIIRIYRDTLSAGVIALSISY